MWIIKLKVSVYFFITLSFIFSINELISKDKNVLFKNKRQAVDFPIGVNDKAIISHLYKKWIKVERDELGYLIYKPCDGRNLSFEFYKDKIIVNYQLDGPDTLPIDTVIIMNNNVVSMVIKHYYYKNVSINIKVVDIKKKLVLWTIKTIGEINNEIDIHRIVMTPVEFNKKFRHVDNPCPDMKLIEKEFLPVEFE